jgi:hypothetical protein
MISVEQVRALLADRNINAVAAGAGVSPRWLYRFKTGEAKVVAIFHGSDARSGIRAAVCFDKSRPKCVSLPVLG